LANGPANAESTAVSLDSYRGLDRQGKDKVDPLMLYLIEGIVREVERVTTHLEIFESEITRLNRKATTLEAELALLRRGLSHDGEDHSRLLDCYR
jgi:hypothetical protein